MGRERKLYFVILAIMILALPASASSVSQPSLDIELVDSPTRGWFVAEENITIDVDISNQGDAITIDTDPSCETYLIVRSSTETVLDQSSTCIGQSRGLDLGANSVTALDQLTWDQKDSQGQLVESGSYSIEVVLEGSGLTSTIPVEIQSAFAIDPALELDLKLTTRDGVVREGSGALLTLNLYNPTSSSVSFDESGCKITSKIDGVDAMWSSCLPGEQILLPFEVRPLLQTVMDLSAGQHEIMFSLGDDVLVSQMTVNSGEVNSKANDSDLQMDIFIGEYDSDTSSIPNSVQLSNQGDEDLVLTFTDTCRVETWLMNQNGDVVHDSRWFKSCIESEIQNLIEADGGIETFNQPEISMFNNNGCGLPPGDYTLFAEAPENRVWTSIPISFSEETGIICNEAELEITQDITREGMLLTITPILTTDITTDIFWPGNCLIYVTITDTTSQDFTELITNCTDRNLIQRIDGEVTIPLPSLSANLEDGRYSLEISIANSFYIETLQSEIELPLPTIETNTTIEENQESEVVVASEFMRSGTWSMVPTQNGECWLLNNDDSISALLGAPTQVGWAPAVGVTGDYSTVTAATSPACAEFNVDGFTITEILSESAPAAAEVTEEDPVAISAVQAEEEEINPIVISTVVVITSTSLIAILYTSIATNESWRIPVTSAGLWFLGLSGRSGETIDGIYQRGRLMGYLTANPGCDFRELMQEMTMSKGRSSRTQNI